MNRSQDDWAHLRPNSTTIEKAQAKTNEERNARAARFHRVFVQNEDGAKVMEEWTNQIMFGAPQDGDTTMFSAGVMEGKRQVVKDIIDQITIIARYRNE